MLSYRASGILLHPTSLPSRFGVGELGSTARQFVDFLAAAGQQFWQVLPLGPTGYGNSPYMCYSALAGNPLLISLEMLQHKGLLNDEQLSNYPYFNPDQTEFDRVILTQYPLYRHAWDCFHAVALRSQAEINAIEAQYQSALQAYQAQQTRLQMAEAEQTVEDDSKPKEEILSYPAPPIIHSWLDFEAFCASKAHWLDDYALFMALKAAHKSQSWYDWDADIAWREAGAITAWTEKLQPEILFQKYLQYEFFNQWSALKKYANDRRVQIIGDIPIYVAHDSADVWANPKNFQLDEKTGAVAQMAGVPPDYFSETGQLWGNPVYNWEYLKKTNFDWWIKRFEAMLDLVDWIRIDHFRGFEAYWSVPQGEETAINGTWVKAPGAEFFQVLKERLGSLPILAEDLGVITPEVEALRDGYDFPGMKVLHFAFGSDPGNVFLPFNYPRNCLVYTGTHDNDTTVGWFEQLGGWERDNLLIHLGCVSPMGIHWDLIRIALNSVANLAIVPLQDVFGLGTDARMNFPGVAEGNWAWRYRSEAIGTDWIRDRLRFLTERSGRLPY
jgi:4-alpha-glucanotransferase